MVKYAEYQNLTKSCKVSELLKVGQDSMLMVGLIFTLQEEFAIK